MALHRHGFSLILVGLIVLLNMSPTVSAAQANVSHSYKSTESIPAGSLVSLANPNSVVLANTTNSKELAGVSVNPNSSLLAVNPSASTIQVATTGDVNTLVTTANGNITSGSEISVSPFNGIGMEAGPGLNVIGLAQTSLSSRSSGVRQETVKNKQGKSRTIYVGYITVKINISTNTSNLAGDTDINGIQQLIAKLTGHVVSTFRIITSLVIALISLLAFIVVIYSAIYSSIISVGRNPLAKASIYRILTTIVILVSIMAAVSCTAIYFLLR